jgi:ATP-dependent RNA helicase MSS116
VEHSALYASAVGLTELPGIPKRTLGKMGLQNVPGLVAVNDVPQRSGGGRGGGGGGMDITTVYSIYY